MNSDRSETSTTVQEDAPRLLAGSAAADRRRRWPWVVGLGVAVLAVYVLATRGASSGAAAGSSKGAARPVPIIAAAARTGDVGVYLNGLGTATALNTVTVRSRVDGELVQVAFHEGQLVHEGDLLAQIDPRPFQVQLIQAEGQLAKDEAALKNALADLERYRVMMEQGVIPKQQLDTQAATVLQNEAALKTDHGQIEGAKLNIAYSRITAPIGGRVGLRLVDAGNMVHANDPNGLVVITQLQPIAVVFTVPADSLPKVMQQMRAGRRLPVEAYDRDLKNRLASGSLLAVDNQIDQATGTVRLKALFGNEDSALFPNQFVNARLLVDTVHQAVIVPTAAVQRNSQATFVYLVKPDQTVELRPVEITLTEGDNTALSRGVAAGELVVVDGIDKLQPGSKVSVGGSETKGEKKAAS
jgi:membrane fusion protein, multidrug efflux system